MATNLRQTFLFLASITLLICASFSSFGQNREKFVISAKAGGINAVTGRAKVHLKGGTDWQQLSVTDDLEAGDVVRTEIGARVEMLLNPGSYLRLGENSEFELVNSSLDNLELRLLRGTAIVEATGTDDTELLINITTPHTKMAIIRHGLYRLNVVPDDATELIVRKGRVQLNDYSHTKVKGGNKVVFSANTQTVAKLSGEEKKVKDDVDNWSKERAETLAQANRRISNRMLATAFDSYGGSDWLFTSRRNSGFWFFNRQSNCYTFLPFYLGWGSPYGSSYINSVYRPSYCCGVYHTGGYTVPSGNTNAGGRPVIVSPADAGSVASPSPRIRDEYPSGRGYPKPDSGSPMNTGSPAPSRTVDTGASPGRSMGKPDIRPDVRPDNN
jgi:FecR protein